MTNNLERWEYNYLSSLIWKREEFLGPLSFIVVRMVSNKYDFSYDRMSYSSVSKDVVELDCKTNLNTKGVFGRAPPLGLLCLLRNGFDSSFFH